MFDNYQITEAKEFIISRGIEPASTIASWDDGSIIAYANHKWRMLNKRSEGTMTLDEIHGNREPDNQDIDNNQNETQRIKKTS